MEYKLNFLTCGYNGTGCSALLSIEYSKRYSSESFIENRILVNTGDSTQRICSEHRIKLSKVSTVIISSLAPHNVSGFASIFLSLSDLGVGELTVYGPSGLKSLLDVMTPLINRRYPVLKVVEVEEELVLEGGLWNPDKEEFKTTKSVMKLLPIYSSRSSSKSVAIAARFDFIAANDVSHHTISYVPVGFYFNTHPNLDAVTHWCFDHTTPDDPGTLSRPCKRTAIFVPVGIISHLHRSVSIDLEFGKALSPSDVTLKEELEQYTQLKQLSSSLKLHAFVYPNELTNTCFEFRHAQRTINKLHIIASELFPRAIYTSDQQKPSSAAEGTVSISSGSLYYAYPMLEVSQPLMFTKCEEESISAQNILSLESFIETTTREEELIVKVMESMESISNSTIPTISSYATSMNSPQLTSLTASFQAETSIQKPPSSSSLSEVSKPNKWDGDGNYDAAQALRERLLHNKRKLSQGNNVVVATATPSTMVMASIGDENKSGKESHIECDDQRSEPLHKRMQRKPSCEVAMSYPWSPKGDGEPTDTFPNESVDLQRRSVQQVAPIADMLNDLFQIYFLGTGCATPSKHRNNSCIMVSLKVSKGMNWSLPPPPPFEDAPFLTLPPAPTLMLPPPPVLTIPSSSSYSRPSLSLNLSLCNNEAPAERVNPFATKPKPALSLDIGVDPGKKMNPFASNKSSKPALALDLGLCGLEPPKPVSRRPSATLSLDLSLCNSTPGNSGVSTPYNDNIASTLFETDENSQPIILFDVGEGTASQLFQLVQGDIQKFDDYLLRIRVIWISHHHADHTTGLPMLLEQVYRAQMRQRGKLLKTSRHSDILEDFSPAAPPSLPSLMTKYDMRRNRHGTPSPGYEANKIMLIASEQLLQFYEYAAAAAGLEELVTFNPISNSLYAGLTREMRFATNGAVKRLQSIPVQHCQNAFGVVMELADGQKIVFSGDCRPSQSLVKSGMNCDVLIHEATFTDDRLEHAMKKRHSTFSEAVDIGRRMGAKHIILTHFSQRYPMTLLTSSSASTSGSTIPQVQPSDSESIASNPPSVGSSGNVFCTGPNNNGLRRGSKSNIFNTTSPPKLTTMKSGSTMSDIEGSSIDDRSFAPCNDNSFQANISIAYDFLGVSFPSQIESLPETTALVANTFSAMEEIEGTDDDKECSKM